MRKYVLIAFLLIPLFVSAFEIGNTENRLMRETIYSANYITKGNYLYVDAKGALEKYEILDNGDLQFITFVDKNWYSLIEPVIIDEKLFYYDDQTSDNLESKVAVLDISGPGLTKIGYVGNNNHYVCNLSTDGEHLFVKNYYTNSAKIYDSATFEQIGAIPVSDYFTIKDSIMFSEIYHSNAPNELKIQNISDFNNPIDLSMIPIENSGQFLGFYFHDNYLFIRQNMNFSIVDISDLNFPALIATVAIPNPPNTSFIEGLAVYNNNLILRDCRGYFYMYDITDLEQPLLVNSIFQENPVYSNNNGLMLIGDYIYYSGCRLNIKKVSASDLPNLVEENNFGGDGSIVQMGIEFKNFIVFNDYDSILYLNEQDENNSIQNLSDLIECSYFVTYTKSDSLLFAETNGSHYLLHIYSSDGSSIILKNTIELSYPVYPIYSFNNYLFLRNHNTNNYIAYEVLPDYTINQVGSINFNDFCSPIERTENVHLNYLFFEYQEGDNNYISIREPSPPFNEVTNFEASINNQTQQFCYLLNDNKIMFKKNNQTNRKITLCNYSFPNQINFLDSYTTGNELRFTKSYFVENDYGYNKVKILNWDNDVISEVDEHTFSGCVRNVITSPETNSVYTFGEYNVFKNDCDFTGISDNNIQNFSNYTLSNYPNPFHSISKRGSGTTISFDLPKSGNVDLTIYNIKGQKVKTLTNEKYPKGKHSLIWNGKNDKNQDVSSGVYFYKLNVEGKDVNVKKCLLMK